MRWPTRYGWQQGEGLTEQIIGRWFAQGGLRRDKTVIGTKLYGSMSDWPNDTFLSARNIRKQCDDSLRRLQTDRIDLYQLHHVDRNTPWDEIWEAFEVLRQQGKVIYFGSSNHAGWHIAQPWRPRADDDSSASSASSRSTTWPAATWSSRCFPRAEATVWG